MFVCHCAVLTDRDIAAAVECGARDECAIAALCGAGRRCGNCLPVVRALLRERGFTVDREMTVRDIRRALATGSASIDYTYGETDEQMETV